MDAFVIALCEVPESTDPTPDEVKGFIRGRGGWAFAVPYEKHVRQLLKVIVMTERELAMRPAERARVDCKDLGMFFFIFGFEAGDFM